LLLLNVMGIKVVMAQTVEEKPYKAQLALVEGRLRQGNISGAIETLDEIISQYPEASEAHYAKALMFGPRRNYDVAVGSAQLAQETDRENLQYANYLVGVDKGSNASAAALGVIDQSLATHKDTVVLYREKLMLLHSNKQSDEALKLYEQA